MELIDWKTELRKIEREMAGLPPERSPEELRAEREATRREQDRRAARRAVHGTAARLLLVLGLAAALPFWPYAARCGARLGVLGAAIATLLLAAVWVAACAWRRRLPRTYAVTLLLVLWALALGAREVLPRVGYAYADPARPPRLACS